MIRERLTCELQQNAANQRAAIIWKNCCELGPGLRLAKELGCVLTQLESNSRVASCRLTNVNCAPTKTPTSALGKMARPHDAENPLIGPVNLFGQVVELL